ncbi:unnamed protein product [Paramecium pentaurelia]|uniref:Peptidase A1 domain-containing protein n=1 Tax=Paramecium pentaurelia TaxID=43138 RepID=A0A8S1S0U3_9CILI|nr:unnamed protein product [Paramecium pentaurelia]
MNLALVCILILSISAFEVRINFEKATSEIHRKQHFSSSSIDNNKLKATEDDSKKYLDDYTLTIPLTLGQTQLKQTIDTTSYISWVYTKQTENNQCTNCPNDAEIFKCEGSCQYQKTTDDQKKIPLTTENTYGGRVIVTGSYATQDSLELMGLKANSVGLGLIDNLKAKEDPKYEFKAKNGVIGLAYGSDYVEYKNKKNAMVGEVKNEPTLQQTHSLIQQFHSQLNNVPASTFALKLEDNLSLLIIGEQQTYFAQSKFTQFTNVGKKVWALKINKISYGLEGNFASTGTAIFDSTTRFIWADSTIIQNFLKEIKNFQIDCIQQDGLYKCPCNDEQFEKYKDIYFSFNLQDKISYPLSKNDYIHREQNQCYLLMKTISDKNTLSQEKPNIIIPYTFFKKNYVLFNQDTNQISISHSYQVNPDEIHIKQNTMLYTAIIGVLLLLLSLFLLVNCLHKAPYDQDYLHQVDSNKNGLSRPVVNYQQPQQQSQQQQQVPQFNSQYQQSQQALFGAPQTYQQQPQRAQPPLYQGGLYNSSPQRANQIGINPQAQYMPGQYR